MNQKKKGTAARSPRKKGKTGKQKGNIFSRYPIAWLCAILVFLAVAGVWCVFGFRGYSGEQQWLYLPSQATSTQVRDSLVDKLGMISGNRAWLLWRIMNGTSEKAHGAYMIENGEKAITTARRLKAGRQTPVKVSFTAGRGLDRMARRIASQLEFTPEQLLAVMDSILPQRGYQPEEFPAAFIPDCYEFYITASPEKVVTRLAEYRDKFWNEKRRAQASKLGLTPAQVATLASIVEEESAKRDEHGKIARLYLNRLDKGIKLQADPTVKFAVGDWKLRRILGSHLTKESPYNTYLHTGLPPGPIRVVDRQTLEAVLDAPQHNYLYMCAKEDFSGRHNFATTYSEHMANARRYHAELNKRNIK